MNMGEKVDVREMSQQMADWIMELRNWVKGFLKEGYESEFESSEGKINFLQAILDNGLIECDESPKLQALGVTFGDALVQELDLEWVEIEDEYGIDPALRCKAGLLLFPLTMISKRVEEGEQVDVRQLFHGVCTEVTKNR